MTDTADPTDASMVLVLGETGAGKSYFIKTLAPENQAVIVGHSMRSCTQISLGVHSMVGGTDVHLVDTPGFNDTIRSDGDIILEISKGLLAQKQLGMKLMGIIYCHDITQTRWTGSLKRQLKIMKLIAGRENFKHILLVTTKWGDTSKQEEFEDRQAELEDDYWEDLIDAGAGVFKFDGSAESARGIVSQLNANIDVTLALQRQMAAEKHVHLRDTDAGKYALQQREQASRRYQRLIQKPEEATEDLDELKTSLAVSADDQAKLETEMYDKIHDMIETVVKDELKKSRRKPTALNVISWILATVGAIFTGVATFA